MPELRRPIVGERSRFSAPVHPAAVERGIASWRVFPLFLSSTHTRSDFTPDVVERSVPASKDGMFTDQTRRGESLRVTLEAESNMMFGRSGFAISFVMIAPKS